MEPDHGWTARRGSRRRGRWARRRPRAQRDAVFVRTAFACHSTGAVGSRLRAHVRRDDARLSPRHQAAAQHARRHAEGRVRRSQHRYRLLPAKGRDRCAGRRARHLQAAGAMPPALPARGRQARETRYRRHGATNGRAKACVGEFETPGAPDHSTGSNATIGERADERRNRLRRGVRGNSRRDQRHQSAGDARKSRSRLPRSRRGRRGIDAIKGIGGIIGEVNEVATAIATAVQQQGAATQEITRSTQYAAQSTRTSPTTSWA